MRLVIQTNKGVLTPLVWTDAAFETFRKGEFSALSWQGTWDFAVAYFTGNVVEHEGSAYVALVENENSEPPSVNWELVVSQGPTGPAGPDGPAGPNNITAATTTTDITGLLKGDGALVSAAVAPTDYIANSDARLSDARAPLTQQAIVALPYPAKLSHTVNVVDAAVTATSKLLVTLAGVADTQTNAGLLIWSLSAVPLTGSFNVHVESPRPIAGPLVINYAIG